MSSLGRNMVRNGLSPGLRIAIAACTATFVVAHIRYISMVMVFTTVIEPSSELSPAGSLANRENIA